MPHRACRLPMEDNVNISLHHHTRRMSREGVRPAPAITAFFYAGHWGSPTLKGTGFQRRLPTAVTAAGLIRVIIAAAGERPRECLLRYPHAIGFSGVEAGDAGVNCGVHGALKRCFVDMAVGAAERFWRLCLALPLICDARFRLARGTVRWGCSPPASTCSAARTPD
jgi:hypothetical protein